MEANLCQTTLRMVYSNVYIVASCMAHRNRPMAEIICRRLVKSYLRASIVE